MQRHITVITTRQKFKKLLYGLCDFIVFVVIPSLISQFYKSTISRTEVADTLKEEDFQSIYNERVKYINKITENKINYSYVLASLSSEFSYFSMPDNHFVLINFLKNEIKEAKNKNSPLIAEIKQMLRERKIVVSSQKTIPGFDFPLNVHVYILELIKYAAQTGLSSERRLGRLIYENVKSIYENRGNKLDSKYVIYKTTENKDYRSVSAHFCGINVTYTRPLVENELSKNLKAIHESTLRLIKPKKEIFKWLLEVNVLYRELFKKFKIIEKDAEFDEMRSTLTPFKDCSAWHEIETITETFTKDVGYIVKSGVLFDHKSVEKNPILKRLSETYGSVVYESVVVL